MLTEEEKKVVEITRLKLKSKEGRLTPLSPSNIVGKKLIEIIDKLSATIQDHQQTINNLEEEINELKSR